MKIESAMSIAGYDPSGGAGVLNDIKTFSALGIYGTAVITALTAQNIYRVEDIFPVTPDFIEKEIELILEQENIKYIKTGMLYSKEIVRSVAKKISHYDLEVVVDPVMVAGSGGFLSKKNFVNSLKKHLLPQAILTTPNISEAEVLSGLKIEDEDDAIEAALKIGEIVNVVITGGHLKGNDIYYDGDIKVIEGEMIKSKNTHGSGCTYSAAITAYLIKGFNIEESIIKAGEFVTESIRNGYKGTLNQYWKI
ncbi:MAG: bifunctional hydroxymethylpyrimidine kinase/phosphomethylpyrimidine kinase [Methanobacteriaceae archaeon]|nr:bifunctional hydroxymethylpyrimidine kinase/phosphomethylpyrimidine kinase [Methanobacteriaceae archaeon]